VRGSEHQRGVRDPGLKADGLAPMRGMQTSRELPVVVSVLLATEMGVSLA